MERAQAMERLKQHDAELKELGVQHLYLFGWTAIGEAQPDSDVDLFFDYEKGALGLFPLVEGEGARTHILARKADIMTRDSLRKPLRRRIEATAVPIF